MRQVFSSDEKARAITIRLPEDTYRAVKVEAAKNDRSFSMFVSEVLADLVNDQKTKDQD